MHTLEKSPESASIACKGTERTIVFRVRERYTHKVLGSSASPLVNVLLGIAYSQGSKPRVREDFVQTCLGLLITIALSLAQDSSRYFRLKSKCLGNS